MSFEVFLGYFTGLRVLARNLPFPLLVGTTLAIHLLDGIICRLLALNHGYRKNLWTVLGLFFGVWAIATLLLLPRRKET